MDLDQYRALLLRNYREQSRRRCGGWEDHYAAVAAKLREDLSDAQLALAEDDSPQIASLGTRRSGKSRTLTRAVQLYKCLTTPDARVAYVNETMGEAEKIAWLGVKRHDGLIGLNEDLELGAIPNVSKLRMTFRNGAVWQAAGANDRKQMNKVRGGAFHHVHIDESQKLPHLGKFIEEDLGPAMLDFGGQLVLSGTPDRFCQGLFFDITRDDGKARRGEWSMHRLNVLDNPFFGDTREERYRRSIGAFLKRSGLTVDAPKVQREWFGKWSKEDAHYVYPVHRIPEEKLCHAVPRVHDIILPLDNGEAIPLRAFPDLKACLADLPEFGGTWRHALGLDLAYSPDAFAFVLWTYSLDHPTAYELASWKSTQLIPDAQAAIVKRIMSELNVSSMVADAGGGGKGIIKGWQSGWLDRYPLPIEEAEKSQKTTYLEFMGNDLEAGRIKLREGSVLHEEMKEHVWAPPTQSGRVKEADSTPNDACDAGLYAYRQAIHHQHRPEEPIPRRGTAEWQTHMEQKHEEAICAAIEMGGEPWMQ